MDKDRKALFEVDLLPDQMQYLLKSLPAGYSFQLSVKQFKRNRLAHKKFDGYSQEFQYELTEKPDALGSEKKSKADSKSNFKCQKKNGDSEIRSFEQIQESKIQSKDLIEKTEKISEAPQIPPQKQKLHNQLKQILGAQSMNTSKKIIKEEESDLNSSELEVKSAKKQKTGQNQSKDNLLMCQIILNRLKNHRGSWPFKQPVDPIAQNVPNYFQIVKEPMDMGTIGKKIKARLYNTEAQFHSDINKIFTNSYLFNPKETIYYNHTKELEAFYLQTLSEMKDNPKYTPIKKKELKHTIECDEYKSGDSKNQSKSVTLKEKKIKKQDRERLKNHGESSSPNEKCVQNSSLEKKTDKKIQIQKQQVQKQPVKQILNPPSINSSYFQEKKTETEKKKIPTIERELLFNKIYKLSQQNLRDLLQIVFDDKLSDLEEQFEINVEEMSRQKYESVKQFVNQKSYR